MMHTTYYRNELIEIILLKNKPVIYREHNHVSTYTIGFIVDGTVTLTLDGKTTLYQQENFFITAPYQVHELSLPENYEMLSFSINAKLVYLYQPGPLFEMVSNLLDSLPITLKLTLVKTAIEKLYKCSPASIEDPNIRVIADMLRQQPEISIDIQKMAKYAYLSKFHYIKRFKEDVGITPHRFQLQNKIRKAQRLIDNGTPLSIVATDLGFFDQSHFIKCFKEVVGLTPLQYKRSAKRLPD